MREPRPIPGAKTPLFDRLQDDGIDVRQPVSASRSIGLAEFQNSVRIDLSRLLNTRSNIRGSIRDLAQNTVLDYGMPSIPPVSPGSETDRQALARLIEKVVQAYEPRLKSVKVIIQQDKRDPRALLGLIQADLVFGNIVEPVYFPLSLDEMGKKIDVTA